MTYTDLTPGTAFMYEGNPYIVVSSEFHRMQMRKAVQRASIRNLISGQLMQKTFTASDRFDPADVDKIKVQYLYHDNEFYHFMDKNNFEQYHASEEVLGKKVHYLNEEMEIELMIYNGSPIQLMIPQNVNVRVEEAPLSIKGDSISNVFKTVTCQNGIKISCPLFIKEGDLIKVNTETGEYLGRA